MGWSGGTQIAISLINTIKREVPDATVRGRIYADLIKMLTETAGFFLALL